MDFETIQPRTCQACHGVGFTYWGNKEDYDVRPCDECEDGSGINDILAADELDRIEMEREDFERIID